MDKRRCGTVHSFGFPSYSSRDAAIYRLPNCIRCDAIGFRPHPAVLVEVETCTPLSGCQTETTIDQEATRALREAEP